MGYAEETIVQCEGRQQMVERGRKHHEEKMNKKQEIFIKIMLQHNP